MKEFNFFDYEFSLFNICPESESVYVHDIEGGQFYWLCLNKDEDIDDTLCALIFIPSGVVVKKDRIELSCIRNKHTTYINRKYLGYKVVTIDGDVVYISADDIQDILYYVTSSEIKLYKKMFSCPTKYQTQQGHFVECALRRTLKIEKILANKKV